MPLSPFDGEACSAMASIEALECVDVPGKQSAMRASDSKVAEASVPNIRRYSVGNGKRSFSCRHERNIIAWANRVMNAIFVERDASAV